MMCGRLVFTLTRSGNALLDFLARYCIIHDQRKLRQYAGAFAAVDRDGDGRINAFELDFGLKTVNKSHITDEQFTYLKLILDIHPEQTLNLRLFTVIAALSERIVELDPFISKSFMQLSRSIGRNRELFALMSRLGVRDGRVPLKSLLIEMRSGNIPSTHIDQLMSKFADTGRDYIDFLDFLAFVHASHLFYCDFTADIRRCSTRFIATLWRMH